MAKLSLEQILSLSGFIISVISLAIHYFNLRYLLPKMKFTIQTNSYYFKGKDFKVTNFESEYFAVISLKISNLSKLPITIDDAYLNYYILNGGHYNDIEFEVPEVYNPKYISIFKTPNENISYTISPYTPTTLPLRIEPFDTILCSFKMSFDSHINRKSHKLFISTPRKTYKVDLTLKEYHELVRLEMSSELSTE